MKTILPSAAVPTNIPSGGRRTYRVTGISVLTAATAPLPVVELVDRAGDVWRETDRLSFGERVLECVQPLDPSDRGDGESFPWTRQLVEGWFGPLVQRTAVAA